MWDCSKCGCRCIAASIQVCPMCFKEEKMPNATSGGPSNNWEPTVEPEDAAPVEEPQDEVPAEAPEQQPEDAAPAEPEQLEIPVS